MTAQAKTLKGVWQEVAREALKNPFKAGFLEFGFAAAHFAGAAALGSPYLLQWGCGWAMMGATYFALHAKSIIHPGPADKLHKLGNDARLQKSAVT